MARKIWSSGTLRALTKLRRLRQTKRSLVMSSRLVATLIFVASSVPSLVYGQRLDTPTIPTAESCREFRTQVDKAISGISARTGQCMRGGPTWSTWMGSAADRQPNCESGPPPRVRHLISAYPSCMTEQEALCNAYEHRYFSVPDCFKRAGDSKSAQDRQMVAASKALDLHQKYGEMRDILSNPVKGFRELVLPRMAPNATLPLDMFDEYANQKLAKYGAKVSSREILAMFVEAGLGPRAERLGLIKGSSRAGTMFGDKSPGPPGSVVGLGLASEPISISPFERAPGLSQKGNGLMFELYSFLHGQMTTLNGSLQQNEIIRAIQGSAMGELKAIHSNLFAELQNATNLLDSTITDSTPARAMRATERQSIRAAPTPISRSPSITEDADCRLLDGPGRTDLAVSEPERYERLVEKCASRR